jgi:hypothetical protein
VRFRQRSAEDCEVLREHINEAAIDVAEARYDTVTYDPLVVGDELGRACHDEGVELCKGAVIKQQIHALARAQLALRVLLLDPGFTAADRGALPQTAEALARAHAVRIGRTHGLASVLPKRATWITSGSSPRRRSARAMRASS